MGFFVSLSSEELKVDEGILSSSNNAQWLMEPSIVFFSRSTDLKGKVDTIKCTVCDPCVNSRQHPNLLINVF